MTQRWIGCVERDHAKATEWARQARITYGCKVALHQRTVRAAGVQLVVWVAVVDPRGKPAQAQAAVEAAAAQARR